MKRLLPFFPLLSTAPLLAGPGELLSVNPGLEAPAAVFAQALLPDGGHLIAGSFGSAESVIRLNPDGSRNRAWRTPLTLTVTGISALHRLPDGRLWVEPGTSGTAGFVFPGFPAFPAGRAVLLPDGRVDTGAFPDLPQNIPVHPEFFTESAVTLRLYSPAGGAVLKRYSLATGAEDTLFKPSFDPAERLTGAAPAGGGATWVLTETGDPWLLPGSGTPLSATLRRLLPGGSPDPAVPPRIMTPGHRLRMESTGDGGGIRLTGQDIRSYGYWPQAEFSHFTTERLDARGISLRAEDLTVQRPFASLFLTQEPDGALLGNFGPSGEIYRLLPDRTLDPGFLLTPFPQQSNPLLDRLPDGRLILDGLRRFLPDGAPDPAFKPEPLFRPGAVAKLAAAPGGRFYVSGNFTRTGGLSRAGLARLNADGSPDSSFTPPEDLGEMADMRPLADGKLLVLHRPSPAPAPPGTLHTVPVLRRLTRLFPDGARDPLFVPKVDSPSPLPVLNLRDIIACAVQPDGRILVSTSRDMGDTTEFALVRLQADGAFDAGFSAPRAEGWIERIDVFPDGRFLTPAGLFAKEGALLQSFLEPGASIAFRRCVEMLPGGRALMASELGGGGESLFLMDSAGEIDRGFHHDWKEGRVTAAASSPDGKIYVSGGQTHLRLHRNGLKDATFRAPDLLKTPTPPEDAAVRLTFTANGLTPLSKAPPQPAAPQTLLHLPATGALWLGGDFQSTAGLKRSGLASLSAGGVSGYEAWITACATGFNVEPAVLAPEADADGDGQSNQLEYATASDPLLPDAPAAALLPDPARPLTFSIARNPEAPEVLPIIEISENLKDWRPATGAEVSLGGSGPRLTFSLLTGASTHRYVRVRFTGLQP